MKRDPTNVELFDMAQSNSEHSRHWFFGAHLVINGERMPESLMQIVKATLKANPGNSVIGFKDNSSAIRWGLKQPEVDGTLDLQHTSNPQPVHSRLPPARASYVTETICSALLHVAHDPGSQLVCCSCLGIRHEQQCPMQEVCNLDLQPKML